MKLTLALSLILLAGCAANSPLARMFGGKTPEEKIAGAEQTYTTVANSLADSIRKGLITDPDALLAIKEASDDINIGLDAAKALIKVGDKPAFDKLWPAVRDRIDQFIVEYAENRQKPKPKETSWLNYPSLPPAFCSNSSAKVPSTKAA